MSGADDTPSGLLATARQAAEAATAVIRPYWAHGAAVQQKPDQTPVTEADVAAEERIREVIGARFPGHAFWGEETGRSSGGGDVLWLVDPIDGTRGFVRGYPMFSTQIAAMAGGELVAGVSAAPFYGETAWAARGEGAFLEGAPIRVSPTDALREAHLSVGNLATLAGGPGWRVLGDLVREAARVRGYGDFLHYHLLAAGRIDAVIETDVNILDIAALAVIVREAGGVFTDLDGGPVTLETTTVLAANPHLHAELLARFQGWRPD